MNGETDDSKRPPLAANGLRSTEVRQLRQTYGWNEVSEKKESLALRFAAKFWGLTPCLLELTIALLLILSKYFEASVVFGLLIFNSILAMPKRRTLMPRNVISFGA